MIRPWDLRRGWALVCTLALAGCGGELSGPGEALRLLATPLESAYLAEEYSATLQVVGGLSPFTFELSEGALPPGLALQGATIRGVPSEEGSFDFTVTVSDGNLSRTFERFSLQVVTPPPATLTLNVPPTEVQRDVTLRGVVSEARGLRGLSSQIRWDPALFELVPESVRPSSERFAVFHQDAPGQLQLDLAVLGGSVSEERRMFEFVLRPLQPTTLELSFDTEFAGDTGHAYASQTEGVRSPLSENASDPTPEDAPENIPDPDPEADPETDPDPTNGGEGD